MDWVRELINLQKTEDALFEFDNYEAMIQILHGCHLGPGNRENIAGSEIISDSEPLRFFHFKKSGFLTQISCPEPGRKVGMKNLLGPEIEWENSESWYIGFY